MIFFYLCAHIFLSFTAFWRTSTSFLVSSFWIWLTFIYLFTYFFNVVISQFCWKKVRDLFFVFFPKAQKARQVGRNKNEALQRERTNTDLVSEKQILYFTQLMLGGIGFNCRLRRNKKEKKKLSLMLKWVTTNELPSGFFVLFYMKYLEPVSRFTPAYVESTRSRAHHPTCPRIEIPGDWCLLRHISPSCWAWLTATVWSQLMNSNRRLPFVIAWFTSNVDDERYFGAQFCHGNPISSNTLCPCSNQAGVLSHHLGFITAQSPFQ